MLWVLICTVHLTIRFFHVSYTFQSEPELYISLNVKKLLARNRRHIWSLSDCNRARTHNHLVCKLILNHLAKLTKWLSCVISTYLYSAFDYMFFPCLTRLSKWVQTLYLPECQKPSSSKQAPYLKFKWQQWDSNPQPPVSSQEFLDIHTNIECRFTLKRIRDMIKTYSQMYRTDNYSQHRSIIWPVWPNSSFTN